jgi:plasmid stabilization system protein ParE
MKIRTAVSASLAFILVLAACPVALGQRLYNRERDEQAQAALALAAPLKNGALFETQLRNLSSLTKKDFETEFIAAKFDMDANAQSLLTWGSAHELVCQAYRDNKDSGSSVSLVPTQAQIKARLDELKAAIADAKSSLKNFQDAVKQNEVTVDPTLASFFDRVGDLEAVQEFAGQLAKVDPSLSSPKTLEALAEVTSIVKTLQTVYDEYAAKVKEFNRLNQDLADLRVTLKKVAIQSLQVDEEHWKTLAAIRAREETERGANLALVSRYMGYVSRLRLVDFDPNETDSEKATFFCKAVTQGSVDEAEAAGREPDFRQQVIIAEYLRELVERAQSMNKDNAAVLGQARAALFKLRRLQAGAPVSQMRPEVEAVSAALRDASKNLSEVDALHQTESDTEKDFDAAGRAIAKTFNDNDRARLERALRAVVLLAQNNSIRNRDMVRDVPQALFDLGALLARGTTPTHLAELRAAQEQHAYSIRKSAVRARAYELTVSTGAQRLALFHKGGIKPSDVAELVFAVSNVAIPPAVLAR